MTQIGKINICGLNTTAAILIFMTITPNTKKGYEDYKTRDELKRMRAVFIIGDALLLICSAVYWVISGGFDYRHITGIIAGSALSLGYFYSLGYFMEKALKRKNVKKSSFSANMFYGIRYASLFGIYSVLLAFGLVNVITALIPLFFPRIYFLVSVIRNK